MALQQLKLKFVTASTCSESLEWQELVKTQIRPLGMPSEPRQCLAVDLEIFWENRWDKNKAMVLKHSACPLLCGRLKLLKRRKTTNYLSIIRFVHFYSNRVAETWQWIFFDPLPVLGVTSLRDISGGSIQKSTHEFLLAFQEMDAIILEKIE